MSLSHIAHKRTIVSIILSLCASIGIASALTISPARLEVAADPGETVTKNFLLINEQDADQVYYTSVENFEAQGETGTPNFIPSKEGLASWVTVQDKVTIKRGERVEIPFTVSVPQGADAGGHFAAIFLSTVPPSTAGGDVAVGAKVGMLILLKVNGELKEGGGVLSFGLKDDVSFVTKLPVQFVYRFNNSGNDRSNPKGEIVIRNTLGIKTDVIDANPQSGNILPGSTRRFEVRWGEEEPLPSSALFFDHVGYEARNFALGLYSAKIDVKFGTTGQSVSKAYFFVFPWHLMLVVIVGLALLLAIFRTLIKRYNRWIIQQAQMHSK
ncbi:MAG: hypothetical protein E6Q68_07430 [Polynucleobacter sp.]|nr:MAG: hypothetical protein E6Q68_07430 [Polynucleobacter sp.]